MSALAAIHVAKKQLGLEEDDYRAVLVRVTGKSSARDLTEGERGQVLEEFRRLGFSPVKPASNGSRRKLEGKYAPKLQALWIGAWNLGIVRNRDDAALIAFVRRQTGIDAVRFLRHPEDANKAIEALKAWMAREAGVEWGRDGSTALWAETAGCRVALAQWAKAGPGAMPAMQRFQFANFAAEISGYSRIEVMINEADWVPVMNALGVLVREKRRLPTVPAGTSWRTVL